MAKGTTENDFDFRHRKSRRPVIKDHAVKHMFYDPEAEMDAIEQMQKYLHDWDHERKISPEVVDYLLWIARNSPSKQHEAYYDIYYTTDRDLLNELYQYTWGTPHSSNPPSVWKTPQMNASLYMVFVAKEPETKLNCHADGTIKSNSNPARWENAYVSIGIAMGLVMRAANAHGYNTGTNKNHGDLNGDCFWEKKLGVLDEVKAGKKKIAYGIGIGRAKEKRAEFESILTELCIGSSDGLNLTTLNENDPEWKEKHPITGKKFKKVKFIDIREAETAVDPSGREHILPKEYLTTLNIGMDKYGINVTEIN